MRYLLIVSLLAMSFQISQAQSTQKVRLGFNIGISRSLWQLPKADLVKTNLLYHDSLTNIGIKNRIGMQIGLNFRYELSEKWEIRALPCIALTQGHILFTHKDTIRTRRIEMTHICLPLQMLWKMRKNTNTPYLFLGLTPKWNIQSDKSQHNITLKNADMSADFGFGYQRWGEKLRFSPELRFSLGLNNLLKNENSLYYVATSPLKYHVVALILNFY
jgi:hypothetical protein